jgi:mono/diheme cytochrome c family protein
MTYMPTAAKHKKDPRSLLRIILLGMGFVMVSVVGHAQGKSKSKPVARQPDTVSGNETFLKYCASCHGEDAKGNGPAALALKPSPADLTTLSRRHEGKYPSGYVSAILKFGRNFAAHGSDDMPVWGSRFKAIDPVGDPTGQQHMDDVVAFIETLQLK